MKKLLISLTLCVLLLVMVAAQASTKSTDGADVIQRGKYVALSSNCAGCHTFGGALYSGGTPFGIAYSPNITPDKQTGIGTYSFEDFERAVRQGISKKGFSLSVMMPPSYSVMTDQDIQDLYAFLMHGLEPVKNAVPQTGAVRTLGEPRAVVPFKPGAKEDAVSARGRYLVESLGHCGFCHSPRNEAGEEKALWASQGSDFLAGGGRYGGWIPISLRGDHKDGLARRNVEDLTEFFLTARNDKTAAFGGMTGIVEYSTQYLTEDDARAMAVFLKSLPPQDKSEKPFKEDKTVAQKLWKGDDSMVGAAIYVDSCATCHKTDGSGYKRFFPELRGNPVILSDDPITPIHITLRGHTLPGMKAAPSTVTMPPFGWRLDDQQVADVVTFIRSSWGNKASAVTAEDVRKIREDKSLFPDERILGSEDVYKLLDKQ